MTEFRLEDVPTVLVGTIRRRVTMEELKGFFDVAFGQVAGAVSAAGGRIEMPPFGWYHGEPVDAFDVSAGFPVAGDVHTPDGGVHVAERPGGRGAVAVHVGPYDTLGDTWDRLSAWVREQGLVPRGDFWEEYVSPPEGDPATWETRLVLLVE
ncbi:MAG: GyrI-like domain-containing protein [Nocardioidaceae bacterium]